MFYTLISHVISRKILMFKTNLKLNYMYYCKNLYLKHIKIVYIYNYIYYISTEEQTEHKLYSFGNF